MKVCIACSGGGHLAEILQIKKTYEKYDNFYITFKSKNSIELSKQENVYFVKDPGRSVKNFIKCIFQTYKILKSERPQIILSVGAGVAVPACYLGKILFKCKVVFIESFCRIEKPSISGKLIYPISDLFLVQWKNLISMYGDKATFKGPIF